MQVILVDNTFKLLLDSRRKNVIMERRMKEKVPCPWPFRDLQKGKLVAK